MRFCQVLAILLSVAAAACLTNAYATTRVVMKTGQIYDGEIVKRTEEYLHLKTDDEVLRIHYSDIATVEGADIRLLAFGEGRTLIPPLSVGRIAGEIFAGMVGGALLMVVSNSLQSEEDLETDRAAVLLLSAYVVGSSVGVYAVGNIGNETGNPLATLVGGLVGLPLGLLFGASAGSLPLAFFGSPVCATMAFNSTRRYRSPPTSETGLINFRDGRVHVSVPSLESSPDSYDRRVLIYSVNLVTATF